MICVGSIVQCCHQRHGSIAGHQQHSLVAGGAFRRRGVREKRQVGVADLPVFPSASAPDGSAIPRAMIFFTSSMSSSLTARISAGSARCALRLDMGRRARNTLWARASASTRIAARCGKTPNKRADPADRKHLARFVTIGAAHRANASASPPRPTNRIVLISLGTLSCLAQSEAF